MKTHQGISFILILSTALLFTAGCVRGEKQVEDPSSCLTGTWRVVESGRTKIFMFNEDHTGFEKQGNDRPSPFTWIILDGTPVIKYAGQTQEWSFPLDCRNRYLNVLGMNYSKQ